MTIDERLEKLTEVVAANAVQIAENATHIRKLTLQQSIATATVSQHITDLAVRIDNLLDLAADHEKRVAKLEMPTAG